MKIIEAKNVGKFYQLGERQRYLALRDTLMAIGKAPFSWLKAKTVKQEVVEDPNRFWALQDLNFEVNQGEVLGIIGRNGAGKSTLLKILSRVTPPTTGEIILRGRVGSLLEVGTGFHPELTGRENIYLNGVVLGMSKKEIDRKFDEIVAFSGISKFLDTPVKRYSSGMQVRLGFAVAAHLEPEILIVDEVLAVGDLEFQKKCLGKMEQVTKEEGRTVLFVSHNLGAVRQLCDRVIVLDKGKVVKIAPTEEALAFYEQLTLGKSANDASVSEKEAKGTGYQFSKIELRDSSGALRNQFKAGELMEIHFHMKGRPPLDKFTVFFCLNNQMGNRVTTGAANPMQTVYFDEETTHVVCKLGPMPLTSGDYWFDFYIGIWGQAWWDTWLSAINFRITISDVFNSGFDAHTGTFGDFTIEQSWHTK